MQGGDRLDGVGAADRLRAGLGQAEMLDLALLDQVLDRAGHVLDRHVGIDAVLIEQIDAVGPEPLQRASATCLDVLRPAVQPAEALRRRRIESWPNLVAITTWSRNGRQRFAHEFLVRVRAVDLGGVEEGDAALDGRPDQRDHLLLVGGGP